MKLKSLRIYLYKFLSFADTVKTLNVITDIVIIEFMWWIQIQLNLYVQP